MIHIGGRPAPLCGNHSHFEVKMSEKTKGIIAFFVLFAALCGLAYFDAHHSTHKFDPRADENSEGQCP